MKTIALYKQVVATVLLCLIHSILFAQAADQQSISSPENGTTGNTSVLTLYPNPSTGSCTVDDTSVHGGKVHVKVVDMGGKQLFSAKEAAILGITTSRLNLNHPASGMFILE